MRTLKSGGVGGLGALVSHLSRLCRSNRQRSKKVDTGIFTTFNARVEGNQKRFALLHPAILRLINPINPLALRAVLTHPLWNHNRFSNESRALASRWEQGDRRLHRVNNLSSNLPCENPINQVSN